MSTEVTDTADGARCPDDPITAGEPGHRASHLFYDPGPLVTEHDGQRTRELTTEDGDVCMTHSTCPDADDHIMRPGWKWCNLLHGEYVTMLDT